MTDAATDNQTNDDALIRIAQSALQQEIVNIIKMVKEGRALSKSHRAILERQAGWVNKRDVIDAVTMLRDSVCEDCVKDVNQLLENLNGVSD